MRKKKQEGSGDGGFTHPAASPRLTPEVVQRKEFRLAFRGYNERDVDAFLDEVTEELGAYLDENRRLQQQLETGGSAGATATPAPLAEAERTEEAARRAEEIVSAAREESERIVSAAREESERIVAEAHDRADQLAGATGGASAIDARAVIAPFLGREREFLQSLGKLVQEHAESVRGMVQSARDGRVAGSGSETGSDEPPAAAGQPGEAAVGTPQPVAEPSEPITVPEAEPEPPAPADQQAVTVEGGEPERQRSLRELFWGED